MYQRAYLTALRHQKRSENLLAPKRNLSISGKKFDDYKGSYFTIGFNKQTNAFAFLRCFQVFCKPTRNMKYYWFVLANEVQHRLENLANPQIIHQLLVFKYLYFFYL